MEEKNWLWKANQKYVLDQVQATNQYTEKFGLILTKTDAEALLVERNDTLKDEKRIEFGESILPKIIFTFCDSGYLSQSNYLETLIRLQQIFFLYKNEMEDEITDEELLNFMREQFDDTCYGDLDYLEGTCLEIFAEAIRSGYRGYQLTQGKGEASKMDLVPRWDRDLYLQALDHILGR